jgi:hypothetical protein
MTDIDGFDSEAERAAAYVPALTRWLGAVAVLRGMALLFLAVGLLAHAEAWVAACLVAQLVSMLVMVGAGVCWLAWFRALYRAAAALGGARYDADRSVFWAWLLPAVSLVWPYRMVQDVWYAARGRDAGSLPLFVKWWWACWIVMSVALGVNPLAETVGTVAAVAGAVLAVRTVRLLTDAVALATRSEAPLLAGTGS